MNTLTSDKRFFVAYIHVNCNLRVAQVFSHIF